MGKAFDRVAPYANLLATIGNPFPIGDGCLKGRWSPRRTLRLRIFNFVKDALLFRPQNTRLPDSEGAARVIGLLTQHVTVTVSSERG